MGLRETDVSYRASPGQATDCRLTEVGLLPRDWQVGLLHELASIRTGIAKNSGAVLENPVVVHYLRVANVQDGFLDLSEMSQLKVRVGDVKRYAVLPGDMLMNEGGDLDKLGRGALWNGEFEPCVHQNHVFVVRCGSRLVPKFLSAWTSSAYARRFFMLAGRQTTNLASINKTSLGQCPVPLPPTKEEQHVIAEALSDADALIESLSVLLAKKRRIKQGAMQELLSGKRRLPGFSEPWVNAPIGSFTDCTAGGTPSTNIDNYWGGDIPWMSSGDLHLRHVYEVDGRITEEGLRNSSTKWVQKDCVLVGLAGQGKTRGTVAMNHIPLCTNQSIAAIFPVASYYPKFLYFNLNSRYDELRELSAGDGGRGGLNLTLIRGLEVPFPCLEEQRAIAEALSEMDTEISVIESRLTKSRDLKQAMMQVLLTGRIRLVQLASNIIPLPTRTAKAKPSSPSVAHNWQINEAVVIGVMAQRFGTEKIPLGRKRRVKLMYLLHRHADGRADGYLKKAAGPYDPKTKYKGPEAIALKNGYVRALNNGTYEGFVAGDKADRALGYFEQWYGAAALTWLEQLHYRKTDDLELLATVDMAMVDLAAAGQPTDLAGVRRVIAAHPEWVLKLSRELFSDDNIGNAIAECRALFSD